MSLNKPLDKAVLQQGDETSDFLDHQTGPFFRRVDWSAFWVSFLVTLGVYFFTLAPTVTLEDAGELAVASDYLGVPHPPGYPIWTLLTWFFQWIFGWVRYNGQPNPAWGVGFTSAFFGALACGLLGMLVSRSGMDILRSLPKTSKVLGRSMESLICWVGGVIGGLLFAFSPVMWSQSVIIEVYSLNAFFLVFIVLLTYRWMCRPKEDSILYVAAFLFGLGLTNHQSLVFIAIGLLAAIWFRDRALFRDCIGGLSLTVSAFLFWKLYSAGEPLPPEALQSRNIMAAFAIVFLIAPFVMYLVMRTRPTEWKRVFLIVALTGLGLSFYAYLPFSSEQNPPINWGYPRTMEGFKHAVSRGQYEKIDPIQNFKHAINNPRHFMALLNAIIFNRKDYTSVVAQFTVPLAILTLIPFLAFLKIGGRPRHWFVVTFASFLSLTVIFIIFQYPQLDVQTLFIGRVQYIQAHAIFALWISYGVVFALTWLEMLLGGGGVTKYLSIGAAFLLPLVPILRNAYDEQYIRIVGGAEQNGHDFGWQFGNWQLRGVNGIKSDFEYELRDRNKFEEFWAKYPNPEYPPEMSPNAVFFGGTDPGRFVPTYMIYSADVRPDVYLITQNALADNTYMNVMRDLYGDSIWIPSQQDSNRAFQQYVEDVQAGRIPAGADVQFKDGRVSVQGVQGVMMINGILAKMIFDKNVHKHDFYVEESYVIPWMYPHLTPHGLIMKINREPLSQLSPEIVKNDREFWDWYCRLLLDNKKFLRDVVARKTFSKLRGAIAGIYTYRRMYEEAEYAFNQAIELYPLSPEANFRLADVFMQQRRFTDARQLIEKFLELDPGNARVAEFLGQIRETEAADLRRNELQTALSSGKADLNSALELAHLYRKLGMEEPFRNLTMSILNDTNIPAAAYLNIAQMYMDARRLDLLGYALQRYLAREPANPNAWIDLAAVQTAMQQNNEAVSSIKRAIEYGGNPVRDRVRQDNRFDPVREHPGFKALIPPPKNVPANLPMNLPIF